MLSDVNSPVSPDAHCASSTSDIGETLSHSNVSFSSIPQVLYTTLLLLGLQRLGTFRTSSGRRGSHLDMGQRQANLDASQRLSTS